jgi:septum formation protein
MAQIRVATTIILASKSPRRVYLLEQAGVKFTVIPSALDEDTLPVTAPPLYVKSLAEAKAKDIAQKYPDKWVIGADTIVLVENMILGKPKSYHQAFAMLKKLSGKTHQVLTGYAIYRHDRHDLFIDAVTTKVSFKTLCENEIKWYIQTKEPFDKAGAYAIQGVGTFLVKRINGSYTNVVGLPVCEVIEYLLKREIIGPDRTA